jgi:hypothetical protein
MGLGERLGRRSGGLRRSDLVTAVTPAAGRFAVEGGELEETPMTDFSLAGTAIRFLGTIEATAYALLPDGCHSAAVTDIYPGGNIQYVVDPGFAQLFVRFERREGPCSDAIRPWSGSRLIPDAHHDQLEVIGEFEGNRFSVTVPIFDFRLAEGSGIDPGFNPASQAAEFVVIALAGAAGDLHLGCRVVPRGSIFPAIFRQVFGPASLGECQSWIAERCTFVDPGDPA